MYEIRFANKVLKQISTFPATARDRILAAFQELQANPLGHGTQKLAGNPITYRYRVGEYRILYAVDHAAKVVTVLEVDLRKNIYRRR
jgi:mRNA interferase RelE/StbE